MAPLTPLAAVVAAAAAVTVGAASVSSFFDQLHHVSPFSSPLPSLLPSSSNQAAPSSLSHRTGAFDGGFREDVSASWTGLSIYL